MKLFCDIVLKELYIYFNIEAFLKDCSKELFLIIMKIM